MVIAKREEVVFSRIHSTLICILPIPRSTQACIATPFSCFLKTVLLYSSSPSHTVTLHAPQPPLLQEDMTANPAWVKTCRSVMSGGTVNCSLRSVSASRTSTSNSDLDVLPGTNPPKYSRWMRCSGYPSRSALSLQALMRLGGPEQKMRVEDPSWFLGSGKSLLTSIRSFLDLA